MDSGLTGILNAEEARKLTESNPRLDEILGKIRTAAESGEYYVRLGYLSQVQRNRLTDLGYHVGPYVPTGSIVSFRIGDDTNDWQVSWHSPTRILDGRSGL